MTCCQTLPEWVEILYGQRIERVHDEYKRKLENLIDDIIDEKDNTNSEAKINSEKVVNKAKSKAEKLLKDVDGILSKIKEN